MITFSRLNTSLGIGNRLFQLAATIAHAKRMGTKAVFPKWKYSDRIYPNLVDESLGYPYRGGERYVEPHFHYAPIDERDNLDLWGFFQSEKYFENAKEEIFAEILKTRSNDPILRANSCAVHVRRGDYLQKKYGHIILDVDYYEKAIEEMGYHYYHFFSDDIEWCKRNFPSKYHYTTSFQPMGDPLDDLLYMSKFDGIICANSTFSLWSAFLSGHDNVIVPNRWFEESAKINESDLVPARYKKIS